MVRFSKKFATFDEWFNAKPRTSKYAKRIINAYKRNTETSLVNARGHVHDEPQPEPLYIYCYRDQLTANNVTYLGLNIYFVVTQDFYNTHRNEIEAIRKVYRDWAVDNPFLSHMNYEQSKVCKAKQLGTKYKESEVSYCVADSMFTNNLNIEKLPAHAFEFGTIEVFPTWRYYGFYGKRKEIDEYLWKPLVTPDGFRQTQSKYKHGKARRRITGDGTIPIAKITEMINKLYGIR